MEIAATSYQTPAAPAQAAPPVANATSTQDFLSVFGSLLLPGAGASSLKDAHRSAVPDSLEDSPKDAGTSPEETALAAMNAMSGSRVPPILLGPLGMPTAGAPQDAAAAVDQSKVAAAPADAHVCAALPVRAGLNLRIIAPDAPLEVAPPFQIDPKEPTPAAPAPAKMSSVPLTQAVPELTPVIDSATPGSDSKRAPSDPHVGSRFDQSSDASAPAPKVQAVGEVEADEHSFDFSSHKDRQPQIDAPAKEASREREKAFVAQLGGAKERTADLTQAKPAAATAAPRTEQTSDAAAVAPSQPIRELSMSISGAGDGKVEVHVSDRAGEIRVDIRSTNPNLTAELQTRADDLVSQLRQKGYHAEISRPVETTVLASRESQNQQSPGGNQSDSQGRGSWQHNQQQQQEQQQRRRAHQSWNDFLEKNSPASRRIF